MAHPDDNHRPQPRHDPERERIARLEKQEAATPSWLAVHDRELIRLFAIAGAGGSY